MSTPYLFTVVDLTTPNLIRKAYLTHVKMSSMLYVMKSRVHDARLKLELPQNRLAELCGVSRQTIHAIEVGKYQPTVTLALKLAKHLNTEVEKLFVLEKED